MDIAQAKQHVKDAVEAYLAVDERGEALLAPKQQRPIFLVGAPGIGKTAIMAQVASELGIGLVSYSMTHHTRQSALGLPLITHRTFKGHDYDASEYTMSEIVASVYDCMQESGVEQGILFLDEINCVSETLYPSMLQLLQFKTFVRHEVPRGWVVVCAGNPAEYNRSVHEFDVATLDRVRKITVEPDYQAWRAYALDKGIHPAVLTFLDVKQDRFYSIEASLDGTSFVTARGWDDLSDIISVFERLGKRVDKALVEQYVQSEAIASEFSLYYDLFAKYRDDYCVDDILAGTESEEVRKRAAQAAFDERLSLIGLLLDALVAQQRAVVERTCVLAAVRDDIRSIKDEAMKARASIPELLGELCAQKARKRAALAASGGASKEQRAALDEQQALLELLARKVERAAWDAGDKAREALSAAEPSAANALGSAQTRAADACGEEKRGGLDRHGGLDRGSDGFSILAALFAHEASMDEAVAQVEERLSHAFAFIEEAFGDAQEMLVFTTELTQRTASARYIAQYGSASYYEHNQHMIPSDRQRQLRERIEKLGDLGKL